MDGCMGYRWMSGIQRGAWPYRGMHGDMDAWRHGWICGAREMYGDTKGSMETLREIWRRHGTLNKQT